MDIMEIFQRMSSGEVAAHSELGTRDESRQMRSFAARITKMKTVTGIKAHALVMKDLVVPFNPFTGEADDTYNAKTPFRPILLVSQALEGIKKYCAANSAIAEKWDKILGASINWSEPPTMEDYFAFKKAGFIKPRVMTYSTVALNFGGLAGFSEYRQRYTVDPTELNENGTYDPENAPIHHQGAVFFNMMLRPEADAAVKAAEQNGVNKEAITAARRAVYAKSPVGFVTPTNLIPFLFVNINVAPKTFTPDRYTDFESYIRYYGFHAEKWGTALKEAYEDNQYDENMDFYDFTVRTPGSDATKGDGTVYTDDDSMELYKALTITNTDSRSSIWSGKSTIDGNTYENKELYAFLFEAAKAYFMHSQEQSGVEGGETFEKLMAASNRFRPISSVSDKFLAACNSVFLSTFAGTKYFTPEVKKANAAFFTAMNPENAMALADVDDDELDAAAAEQQSSVAALIAAATDGETDETGDISELSLSDD